MSNLIMRDPPISRQEEILDTYLDSFDKKVSDIVKIDKRHLIYELTDHTNNENYRENYRENDIEPLRTQLNNIFQIVLACSTNIEYAINLTEVLVGDYARYNPHIIQSYEITNIGNTIIHASIIDIHNKILSKMIRITQI